MSNHTDALEGWQKVNEEIRIKGGVFIFEKSNVELILPLCITLLKSYVITCSNEISQTSRYENRNTVLISKVN